MLLFTLQVFSDFAVGNDTLTSPEWDEILATADALEVHAQVDRVAGSTPTFTLTLEHSGDRRNWLAKGSPLVGPTALSTTTTNFFVGGDPGTSPTLGFARLRIGTGSLVGGGRGRVVLHVTGRTR